MTHYRHDAWQDLIGALVEVRKDRIVVREGLVDGVMDDSSGIWIAADGVTTREFIEAVEGYEVWVQPRQLEGKHAFRMTWSALQSGPARWSL